MKHPAIKKPHRWVPTVFTIGHSNRSLDDFLKLLDAHHIEQIIDIRTVPRSRHNPQFNGDALAKTLPEQGISYTHLKHLGGLRRARADSTNLGWRNASFRGFADYMETPEFQDGLDRAVKFASAKRTALMCAEAVPWRCHRSLVSDALKVRGIPIEHILGSTRTQTHALTPFARVRQGRITYPNPEKSLFEPTEDRQANDAEDRKPQVAARKRRSGGK